MIPIETRIKRRHPKSIIFVIFSLLILTSIFCWANNKQQFVRIFWEGIPFEVKAPDNLIRVPQTENIYYTKFVSKLDDIEKMKNSTFDYQNSIFQEFTVGAVLEADFDPDKFDPKAHVVQYYLYPEDAIYFGNIPDTIMSRMGVNDCTGKCVISFNGVTKVKGLYFDFTYIVAAGKLMPSDFLHHENVLESSLQSFIELNQ